MTARANVERSGLAGGSSSFSGGWVTIVGVSADASCTPSSYTRWRMWSWVKLCQYAWARFSGGWIRR